MPTPTGEVFSFPEGHLVLWASASGNTSGSGVAFCQDATLRFTYGWREDGTLNSDPFRSLTGLHAALSVGALYADRTFYNIANGTAAVNAKFEGLVTGAGLGKSAIWQMYSGVVDSVEINQAEGQVWRAAYAMHSNKWSAFGQ